MAEIKEGFAIDFNRIEFVNSLIQDMVPRSKMPELRPESLPKVETNT